MRKYTYIETKQKPKKHSVEHKIMRLMARFRRESYTQSDQTGVVAETEKGPLGAGRLELGLWCEILLAQQQQQQTQKTQNEHTAAGRT